MKSLEAKFAQTIRSSDPSALTELQFRRSDPSPQRDEANFQQEAGRGLPMTMTYR